MHTDRCIMYAGDDPVLLNTVFTSKSLDYSNQRKVAMHAVRKTAAAEELCSREVML